MAMLVMFGQGWCLGLVVGMVVQEHPLAWALIFTNPILTVVYHLVKNNESKGN